MASPDRPRTAFPDLFPPREVRILGAGRFGSMAAEKMSRKFPDAVITVTDRHAERVEQVCREAGVAGEVEESIYSITKRSLSESVWVIPAVPVHVGFEWLLHELAGKGEVTRLAVPESAALQVPNPIRAPSGTVYASFATFICPDYCVEPEEICTKSGKARITNLFEVFDEISVPEYTPAVLRSWQLAAGVGGYPVRSLNELLGFVGRLPGKYLIGTSCRCHGVLDALEWG